eukprot:SAG11_NODE_2186_length_3710_cov_1.860426_5_plen_317_part_00
MCRAHSQGHRKKKGVLGSAAQYQTVYIDDIQKEEAADYDTAEAAKARSKASRKRHAASKQRQLEAQEREVLAIQDAAKARNEALALEDKGPPEGAGGTDLAQLEAGPGRGGGGDGAELEHGNRGYSGRGDQTLLASGGNGGGVSGGGGGGMDELFEQLEEEAEADAAERGGGHGAGLDIAAIVAALEVLETRTIVRFGQLQEAVAIMASKVGVLEQRLTADLEFDAIAHAAAQRGASRAAPPVICAVLLAACACACKRCSHFLAVRPSAWCPLTKVNFVLLDCRAVCYVLCCTAMLLCCVMLGRPFADRARARGVR